MECSVNLDLTVRGGNPGAVQASRWTDRSTADGRVQAALSSRWLVRRFALPLPLAGIVAELAGIGAEARP